MKSTDRFQGSNKHTKMECKNQKSSNAEYDCLLFEYMVKKLGIDQSQVADMCYLLYKYYGTTMAGLKAVGYDLDYDDYHSFVHGRLPYELLKPDPVMKSVLLSLPIRKVVFTNSDKTHALRALARLGLEDCFDRITCFETLNPTSMGLMGDSSSKTAFGPEIFEIMKYAAESNNDLTLPMTPIVCKPFKESFEQAFRIAEIDPGRTLFFDDSIRNLLTAKRIGLHTVLVGSSQRPEGADYALESIHNIKEAFPELLAADDKAENVRYSRKDSIEMPVPA